MHDPLSLYDHVHDELDQRRESGYDVDTIAKRFATTAPSDNAGLLRLAELLDDSRRESSWRYDEPDDLDGILATLPPDSARCAADPSTLADKIYGGWLGRIAGCNLGKPVEQGDHWTVEHLRKYLELADAYPLLDYIPLLDPVPEGFTFRENWPETTRGRVDGSSRDDDIDYAILCLHMLERHGDALRPQDVGRAWLELLPYLQVYTAERVAYRNLLRGLDHPDVARHRNPYREWIGALIRGDVFGYTNPGSPRAAAIAAYQDASLSHVGNGIYGEMWSAALVSAAFTASSPRLAFVESLRHIPPRSRLYEALNDVLGMHAEGDTWEQAIAQIDVRYGLYSWVHTINNAALIAAGLLWGGGEYSATVGLTVQGGWDTDSNGATAGSVAGVLLGADALPVHFVEPLHDRVRSALFGFDNSSISDLAHRTLRLVRNGVTDSQPGRNFPTPALSVRMPLPLEN